MEEDSIDNTRLILTYDFNEGGGLFDLVTGTVIDGTILTGNKVDLNIVSDPFGASLTEIFAGCFLVKYEQFTGFGQDIQLKERVIVDCDIRDP